jgi:hypothetical protein
MPQPWGGTEAHTLDEMRQYLESKAAKPRPQSFDYAPPSSGSGGLPRATGGSGANMAAAFFPAHAAADFGMSSHVPGIAVPAGHGFAGGPEPGGSMYPARWATPGFFAGRGTGELPPAGMAVPPIPLGSRSGFGRTPGVGPRATADLVPWSVAPAALRAVGPPAAAVPPVRSSASLPPLPHPPAVSIAALARPLGNAGRIAGHNIAALLNGPLSGLFGGFLGGADTGTFAAGQTAAHPAAVSNGNPYGMSPLAAVGWNMPSFSPGSGGSSDAYRTNTGWTVDQYGARVPTGSYVNSAGKTITYAMA